LRINTKALKQLALLWLLTCSLLSLAQTQRPMDMWVFRCVLDGKPKALVAALHKDLYIGYDTDNCQLFKAWKGGVKFDGAVYSTTKHGPQPISLSPWYQINTLTPTWKLLKNNQELKCKTTFKGYVWQDNKLVMQYDVMADSVGSVSIEEWPEFTTQAKTGKPGLVRKIKVLKNEAQLQPVLLLESQGLKTLSSDFKKGDLLINTPATLVQKSENYTSAGTLISTLVAINLPATEIEITTFFTETTVHP
jgi:cytochrome c